MTLNFKNKAGYRKWLAFGHIHKIFERSPGNQRIKIAGHAHHVNHGMPKMPKFR